ncbi:MAG: hypothetical protein ACREQY_16525 [Candidatus Binatia bacterium]
MATAAYDPAIRRALRELNRIPGVRTRASCQGRFSPEERSSHADLAYVTFHAPVPIALEEHLLAALGDLAQVAPESIYSRWPERNHELCDRLAEAAQLFRELRRSQSWEEWRVPLTKLLEPIERALRADSPVAVEWCLDCSTDAASKAHDGRCRLVTLLEADPGRRLATFGRFLANDPDPPDPRLREREGDRQVLERVERGDFGRTYRRAWERFTKNAARDMLRGEVRARIQARRVAGDPVDFFFQAGKAVFVRRAETKEAPPSGA